MVPRILAVAAAFTALTPLSALAQNNIPAPIETEALSELNAWTVSALSRANGALAPDLWTRSDPAVLATALDRLPVVYQSPAAQALARRVLFSGGAAPSGDSALAARKRFEALGKMGAADELATMAAGAGADLSDPGIAMFAAQAELARGRRAEACARGRSANAGERPPPFLLRLRAYCAAATGDRAAADLALELARAQNAADAWYTAAIAAAGGAPGARPPAARYDNSLSTQLSLAGGLRPGRNALGDSSTLALLALARADNAPQPQRAQAAALAFRRGAISAQEARTILAATPAETATGLPPIVTALRRVQTSAVGTDIGADGAQAIANVLRQATTPADFHAAASFFRTEIAALQTAPDAAATVLFARAAIATGDAQVAQRLAASARQAGAAELVLGPLDAAILALTDLTGPHATMALHRRIDAGGASGARAAARDVTILAALGAPVDETAQAFLAANPPQGGARADAEAMTALAGAVERGATAEAALLTVTIAGERGPARLDTESLERIIRALRTARLEEDARRIAVEAILAGPPPAR